MFCGIIHIVAENDYGLIDIWSGIEVVITGLTRNQLTGNRPWVRIPPAPPYFGMWLSLVEHYVRDVGAAGSNPVIPTI